MGKLKLIASNLLTALVVAAGTSAFWIVAFNNGKVDDTPAAAAPAARAQAPTALELGPTGLAIPVVGVKGADLLDTYKQARAGGARVHDAIDIMAPEGRAVLAAADGTVEKLFFSKGGGGISLYVRSPDQRWTYYYAHLQRYAPGLREGQRVRRGQLLGYVGITGNANPSGPHLHFAINRMQPGEKWYQGTPTNPYPLLAGKRASG